MNPFEFTLAVIILVFAFVIIKHKLGIPDPAQPNVADRLAKDHENDRENDRLRAQVQQLQDRIRVLERIVTDRGLETAAQIEALRERDQIPEERGA